MNLSDSPNQLPRSFFLQQQCAGGSFWWRVAQKESLGGKPRLGNGVPNQKGALSCRSRTLGMLSRRPLQTPPSEHKPVQSLTAAPIATASQSVLIGDCTRLAP